MTTENQKLLSDLLVLKTGLSLMSEEADKIAKAEKDYEEKSREYSAIENEVQMFSSGISKTKKETDERRKRLINDIVLNIVKKVVSLLLLIGGWALVILGAVKIAQNISFLSGSASITDDEGKLGVALVVLGAASILIWLFTIPKRMKNKSIISYSSKEYKASKDKQIRNKQSLQSAQSNFYRLSQELSVVKSNYEDVYQKSTGIASIIYKTLYTNYNDVLRVQYWKFIDLIFDYIDSGIAENKKEALLLAIQQEQTNQITNAIEKANANICFAIYHSTNELRNDINANFSVLSKQMAAQHKEMLSSLTATNDNLKAINERMAEFGQELTLSNSLLEKSNQNSMKLVSDMEYVTHYVRKHY